MTPTQEARCQACTTDQKQPEQKHERGATYRAFSNGASTAASRLCHTFGVEFDLGTPMRKG